MPNWCSNDLVVTGPKEDLKALAEADIWNGEMLSFQKIDPCPQELLDTESPVRDPEKVLGFVAKYGHPDWYDWSCAHWGTKWDLSTDSGSRGIFDESVTVRFDTAWAPPIQAIETLSGMFPTLEFVLTFLEPGMCFAGIATISKGETESDESWRNVSDPEFQDIIEVFGMEDFFAEMEEDEEDSEEEDDEEEA